MNSPRSNRNNGAHGSMVDPVSACGLAEESCLELRQGNFGDIGRMASPDPGDHRCIREWLSIYTARRVRSKAIPDQLY